MRLEQLKRNKELVDQFYRELDEAIDPRKQWVEKPLATKPYRDWHHEAADEVCRNNAPTTDPGEIGN